MFARHVRPLAADLLILTGQLTLGEPGYPHHVGVVVQEASAWQGPRLVQAMPSGAEEITLDERHWTPDHVYLRPPYGSEERLIGLTTLTVASQGIGVAAAARRYLDTPYSYLDYAAILGRHLGVKDGRLRRYVRSTRHMICSQLADQAMADAGFHVFDDGRWPQDVTPAALYAALLARPGTASLTCG